MAISFIEFQKRTIKNPTVRDTISNIDSLLENLPETERKELLGETQQIEQKAKEMGFVDANGAPKMFKQGKYENYLAGIVPALYTNYEKIYMKKN